MPALVSPVEEVFIALPFDELKPRPDRTDEA